MLDAVDKVIKQHIQQLLTVRGKPIAVFAIATADQDDQPFTQAGLAQEKKPDKIDLPFAALTRLPDIDITDYNMTKRVHNYTGYTIIPETKTRLTYYRCTLHYTATIFGENRKVTEDLATSLYNRLRNHCQVKVLIHLPIQLPSDPTKHIAVQMDSDIILSNQISQVNPQSSDKAQLYKARISFDLANVNVYDFLEDKSFVYNVFVQSRLEGENTPVSPKVQVFPTDAES